MSMRHAMPLAGVLMLFVASQAPACDLCAVYAAAEAQGLAAGPYLALSEQFTSYDRLRRQGRRVGEDSGQYLDSSITQFILGYGLSESWSVQLSLPWIERWYRRPMAGMDMNESGRERGLGDLTLTVQYSPWRVQRENATLILRLLAGVKFPTGSSDRLREELGEMESEPDAALNGIHGHDLALGSGSIDGLIGGSLQGRMRRWLAHASLQYAWRRRGDFDYRFGDDLQWSAGFGRYLMLRDEDTLALQLAAEGEYKNYDDLAGRRLDDTHSGSLMLGPQVQWTAGTRYALEARALWPVQTFNSEVQTTAGYRLRLALGYRF